MGVAMAVARRFLVAFCLLSMAGAVSYDYWIEDCSPSSGGDFPRRRLDPCRPGGKWDELLSRCNGYFGRECFQCYHGELCKEKQDVQNCSLHAGVHSPVAFDEYWAQFAGSPCSNVPAGFRLSYQFDTNSVGGGMMLEPLDKALRELHAFIENAETEGYAIFPSLGATQGVEAALFAVSQRVCMEHNVDKADVFAQRPYYSHFEWIANFSLQTTRWNLNADPAAPTTIEIVTWPNNPDGRKLQPLQPDPKLRVYDLSFDWPVYTDIETKIDEEIMVFSGSKHSGLAGSRGGWVIVKDSKYAEGVAAYIANTTIGVPVDCQLRVLAHVKHILGGESKENRVVPFYDFMGNMTRARFAQLEQLFTETEEYELVNAKAMGGLAWVKCKREGYSCQALFEEVGLIGFSGLYYGANDSYVRFTMGLPDVEHAIFVQKIKMRFLDGPLPVNPQSHLKLRDKRNAGIRSFP